MSAGIYAQLEELHFTVTTARFRDLVNDYLLVVVALWGEENRDSLCEDETAKENK